MLGSVEEENHSSLNRSFPKKKLHLLIAQLYQNGIPFTYYLISMQYTLCSIPAFHLESLTEGDVISGGVDMSPKSSNWLIFCRWKRNIYQHKIRCVSPQDSVPWQSSLCHSILASTLGKQWFEYKWWLMEMIVSCYKNYIKKQIKDDDDFLYLPIMDSNGEINSNKQSFILISIYPSIQPASQPVSHLIYSII